ncbi:MAG TPA: NYN domain-containing protein [Candidatus Bathyarchaeota archaeon]|nr:NYN domain-containing protein [Candidatus Bathyarchaeota archaeon]
MCSPTERWPALIDEEELEVEGFEGEGPLLLSGLEKLLAQLAHSRERVMVFIDGPYLYAALRQIGQKIDYFRLVRELSGSRWLIRSYLYLTYDPADEEDRRKMENFIKTLERGGAFSVKAVPKHQRGGQWVEKGAYIALVSDMLVMAFNDAYDTAILVSGDLDLVAAVEAVKARGKRVEVAMFSNAMSEELRRAADRFVPLEFLLDRIRLEGRG